MREDILAMGSSESDEKSACPRCGEELNDEGYCLTCMCFITSMIDDLDDEPLTMILFGG